MKPFWLPMPGRKKRTSVVPCPYEGPSDQNLIPSRLERAGRRWQGKTVRQHWLLTQGAGLKAGLIRVPLGYAWGGPFGFGK